jgi:hypothetical protein
MTSEAVLTEGNEDNEGKQEIRILEQDFRF